MSPIPGSLPLVLSTVVLGLALHAQIPGSQTTGSQAESLVSGQIGGHVTQAANGSPVEGAIIQLIPPYINGKPDFQSATTDNHGDYRFFHVRDGSYTIQVSADGFVSQTWQQDVAPDRLFQHVDASTRLQGIDFQLRPEAVIRGAVSDRDGKPVVRVSVALVQKPDQKPDAEAGMVHPPAISSIRTAADGQFAFKGVAAGTYFVCVNGPAGYNAFPDASGGWYRETWYGDAPSQDAALPITIRAGETRSGVIITANTERRYRVIIWPSGPANAADSSPTPDRYDVMLKGRSHESRQLPNGSYQIPGIPSGHYTLDTVAWLGMQYLGAATTDFDVSASDVILHVQVGGLGQISGVVQWIGPRTASISSPVIGIGSAEGVAQAIFPDATGRFVLTRVLPGSYIFRPLPQSSRTILHKAECGGREITAASPLVIGDRQKVTDCALTLANP